MSITKQQIVKIKIQLKKLDLDSQEMAASYSDNRTTHISKLKGEEARQLIEYLAKALNEPESPKDKMCRKIISMAHELGWKKKGKIDMERVNNWCLNYGYIRKKLNDYHEYELPPLVTQFENMYKKHFKTL